MEQPKKSKAAKSLAKIRDDQTADEREAARVKKNARNAKRRAKIRDDQTADEREAARVKENATHAKSRAKIRDDQTADEREAARVKKNAQNAKSLAKNRKNRKNHPAGLGLPRGLFEDQSDEALAKAGMPRGSLQHQGKTILAKKNPRVNSSYADADEDSMNSSSRRAENGAQEEVLGFDLDIENADWGQSSQSGNQMGSFSWNSQGFQGDDLVSQQLQPPCTSSTRRPRLRCRPREDDDDDDDDEEEDAGADGDGDGDLQPPKTRKRGRGANRTKKPRTASTTLPAINASEDELQGRQILLDLAKKQR